ncbi:Integrator complex subunit 4 [Larimichthys crocea]|uniref:Uncharacterized protein n=1 Tax=Larimichthys crocea TaxID=215358 RepID=A0ACD3QK63_LARCR|nr:Integrator complex subunit 4 [Larimichthys crocea]
MVRNKCLQLLGCLGTVDSPLTKDSEGLATSLGGVRDVQSIISDYFGDQDPRVRTGAIKSMLQLHERGMKIHEIIYDQRKRTAHERAKELFTSGEFSSGRKWADDAPKEKLDTNTVNLIASGACGAFVHGLEDEMFEVRIAAVEALCQLARSSASFAEKCLDFLVDMFNDEIEEFLGSRHPTLVLPLVPELLSTHPYFDTPEPDMDDPAYIAVLVLVFNAAKSCPTMPALFSDHTFRHYAYLRDSLSHLVPPLRDSFVDKLLELMPRLSSCKPVELVKILQTTLRQSGLLQLRLQPEQIHRATATIIEPTGESDNPLRFTSGLVVALDIDATLEHVQDPQNTVKVQVLYPDGQSHVIHPKPGDFRKPGPARHRLITQVYLSHTAWTEPSQIEVRLLLAYSSSSSPSKLGWSDSIDSLPPPEAAVEGTIPFSKPVKVFIMPKPTRR